MGKTAPISLKTLTAEIEACRACPRLTRYLAAVARKPTPKELEASLAHIAAKGDQVVGLEDVCWALLNTNEFLFQH